jgi:hypothetical protein
MSTVCGEERVVWEFWRGKTGSKEGDIDGR